MHMRSINQRNHLADKLCALRTVWHRTLNSAVHRRVGNGISRPSFKICCLIWDEETPESTRYTLKYIHGRLTRRIESVKFRSFRTSRMYKWNFQTGIILFYPSCSLKLAPFSIAVQHARSQLAIFLISWVKSEARIYADSKLVYHRRTVNLDTANRPRSKIPMRDFSTDGSFGAVKRLKTAFQFSNQWQWNYSDASFEICCLIDDRK